MINPTTAIDPAAYNKTVPAGGRCLR
jgi:hypothetical protein